MKRLLRVFLAAGAVFAWSFCGEAAETSARAVKLELRLVHADNDALVKMHRAALHGAHPNAGRDDERKFLEANAPEGYELLSLAICEPSRVPEVIYCYVSKTVEMDSSSVRRAVADSDSFGTPRLNLSLDAEGSKKFADLTGRNVGRQLAILIDGKLCCSPLIRAPISNGEIAITGSFTPEELDAVVKGLNVPCPHFSSRLRKNEQENTMLLLINRSFGERSKLVPQPERNNAKGDAK